jgi:hypothetical protein
MFMEFEPYFVSQEHMATMVDLTVASKNGRTKEASPMQLSRPPYRGL